MWKAIASVMVVLCSALPVAADLEAGLIAYYPFNGNADDESGNGNHGTVTGGPTLTFDRFGDPDRAYHFTGAGKILADSPFGVTGFAIQPFTVSAWFATDTTKDRASIVSQWYSCGRNPRHFSVILDSISTPERLYGEVPGVASVSLFNARESVLDDVWHHVVFWRSTTHVRLYVDGVLVDEKPAGPGDSRLNIGSAVVIGGLESNSACDADFEGKIDEVRIYDRTLSDDEITDLYCIDEDADGFCVESDCDDSDPDVYPGAIELPGNFVDEDCNGDLGDCNPCNAWRNHGQYVRCVSHTAEDLVEAGLIGEEDGDALVSSAAQSQIGKQGYTPPECE